MHTHCAVQGCPSKSSDPDMHRRFISIPSGGSNATEDSSSSGSKRLSQLRRKTWLERIHKKESEVTMYTKICHIHFIKGKTTSLWEVENPDWAPSLHLPRDTPVNEEKESRERKTETKVKQDTGESSGTTQAGPTAASIEPSTHFNHGEYVMEETDFSLELCRYFEDQNQESETMSTYRLHWPGLSTLKIYIANPQTDELYGPDNPLPISLDHLNIIENKYVGIQTLMSRFGSEKSQQIAQDTLSSMLLIQGMKPLLVKNKRKYIHLSCLLAFITVFPYCAAFQKCKGVLLHFLLNYMETICSNCGFIHRDCVCKADQESHQEQTKRLYKSSSPRQTQDAETQTDNIFRNAPSIFQSTLPLNQPFEYQSLQKIPRNFSVLPPNIPVPPMYQGRFPMPNLLTGARNDLTLIPMSHVYGSPGNNPMCYPFPLQSIVRPELGRHQIVQPNNLENENYKLDATSVNKRDIVKANRKKQKLCKDVHVKTTKERAADKSEKKEKLKKNNANRKAKDTLLKSKRRRVTLKQNMSKDEIILSDEESIKTSNAAPDKTFKSLDIPEIKTEPPSSDVEDGATQENSFSNNCLDLENGNAIEDRQDRDGEVSNYAAKSSLNSIESSDMALKSWSSEKQEHTDKNQKQGSKSVKQCPLSKFPVKIALKSGLSATKLESKSKNLKRQRFEAKWKQIDSIDATSNRLSSCGNQSPFSEHCFEHVGDEPLDSMIEIGYAKYKYIPSEEVVVKCTMCKKTPILLDTETFGKLHRKTHICWPVMQSLKCTVCAFKVVPNKWSCLLKHMHFAHDVHGYIENKKESNCFLCGLEFASKEERDDHLLYHYLNKYSCIKCGVSKLSWKLMEQHKPFCCDKKLNPKHHGCPYCSLVFKNKDNRDIHVGCHKDEGFMCSICGDEVVWNSWISLKIHLCTVHEVFNFSDLSSPTYFKCDKCEAEFMSRKKLGRHSKKNHADSFQHCARCTKKFKTFKMLQTHQEYAHGEKATCAVCGFEATSKKTLIEHNLLEHTQKDYLCNKCGLTFRNNSALKMHLTAHAGEKFTCEHCYKAFKKHVEYHQHKMRYHAVPSAKPVFECEHCGYRFNTKTSLKVHRKRHHPSKASDTEVDDHCYWNKKMLPPPQEKKKVVEKKKVMVRRKKKILKKKEIFETTEIPTKCVNKKYTKRQIDFMKRKAIKNVERKVQKTKMKEPEVKLKAVKKPLKNKSRIKKRIVRLGCARLKTLSDFREEKKKEAEERQITLESCQRVREEEQENMKDRTQDREGEINSSKMSAFLLDHCYFKQDSDSAKGKAFAKKVNDCNLVIVNAPDVSEFQECETCEVIEAPTSVSSEEIPFPVSQETAKKLPEKVSILKPTTLSTCFGSHSILGELMASENEDIPGEVSDLVIETCMDLNTESTADGSFPQISDMVEESAEMIPSPTNLSKTKRESKFMQNDHVSSSVDTANTEMLIETIDKEVFDHSDEKESNIDTMMELDDIELKDADYQLWEKTNEDNTASKSTAGTEQAKREEHVDIVSTTYLDHKYF